MARGLVQGLRAPTGLATDAAHLATYAADLATYAADLATDACLRRDPGPARRA